jgi:hypothetical protein
MQSMAPEPWPNRHRSCSRLAETVQPLLASGSTGSVSWLRDGQPLSVIGFTIKNAKIVEIDVRGDPVRLRRLNLTMLNC